MVGDDVEIQTPITTPVIVMAATTWNHTKRVEICRRSHVVLLFLLLLKILGWPEERSIDSNQVILLGIESNFVL